MGKRKNKQGKKKKHINVSLGPTPEEKNQQKTKNIILATDKIIHSTLRNNAEALNSTVIQQPDYASVLRKGCKNTNLKNVKSCENIESKASYENECATNQNLTFQDTVQEELLDFFGSPHISDYNSSGNIVTETIELVGKKAVSDQVNGVKHKTKSYVNHSTVQDFKEKTIDMSLKENSYVNNGKWSDESTSNVISDFHSGYKFANENYNLKPQHPKEISNTSRKIKNGKRDPSYVKIYETSTYEFQRTVSTTQKENSLSVEKYKPDQNSSCTVSIYQNHYKCSNEENYLKSKNLKKISTSKDNYNNVSSCLPSIKHLEISGTKDKKIKQKIYSRVNAFKESNYNFDVKYRRWHSRRMQTLEELKNLVKDLHENQLAYNKTQKTCREIGCVSRAVKYNPSALGFIASVSAFLSDAASGITSAVQAVSVDSYLNKFQEIMNLDSEATKDLYNARSRCVVEYQGIEEIMRMSPTTTFNSTVSAISKDLEVKKFWMDISDAYKNDDTFKMLSVVGHFLENSSQFEVLEKIGDSIVTYVHENPAAVEACYSTCRAARGAFDSLFLDNRKTTQLSVMADTSNKLMMINDAQEIGRLNCIINEDSSQSKLEDKIYDTIDSLQFEMEQITDAFDQQIPISEYSIDYDFYPCHEEF